MSSKHLFVDTHGICLLCNGVVPTTIESFSISNYSTKEAFNAFLRYIKVDLTALDHVSASVLNPLMVTLPEYEQGDDNNSDVDVHVKLCSKCATLLEKFHVRSKSFESNQLQLEKSLQALSHVMVKENSEQDKLQSKKCSYCPLITNSQYDALTHVLRTHTVDVLCSHMPPEITKNQCCTALQILLNRTACEQLFKCFFCNQQLKKKIFVKLHMMRAHLNLFVEEVKKLILSGSDETEMIPVNNCQVEMQIDQIPVHHRPPMPPPNQVIIRQVCGVCKKSFATKSSLGKHKKVHWADSEKTACSYCPYTTADMSQLRIHVKEVHTTDLAMKSLSGNLPREQVAAAVNVVLTEATNRYSRVESINMKKFQCPQCNRLVTFPKRHILGLHLDTLMEALKNRLMPVSTPFSQCPRSEQLQSAPIQVNMINSSASCALLPLMDLD